MGGGLKVRRGGTGGQGSHHSGFVGPSSRGRSFVFIQRSKGKCGGVEQGLACPHSQICHGLCMECAKREFQGASWGDQSASRAPVQNGGQGQGITVLAVRKSGQAPDAKSRGWVLQPASSNPVQLHSTRVASHSERRCPPHGCVTSFLWVTTSICKYICVCVCVCVYV